MKLIENTSELISFCQELNRKPFIAVDLEFLREKSYYAKLCLIQVAAPDTAAIIDPLAPGIELEAFFAVLHNPEVVKVFHSGRQDIEIIYHQAGFIPEPLFDTQTAAQVFGFGEAISYENLVKTILGIQLDKSCRLSDWSLRPLDAKQLEYALSDVTHLVPVYEHLRGKLAESGREHWLDEEFAALADPETYIVHPEDVWQKIKHRSHNGRLLTVLRELAARALSGTTACSTLPPPALTAAKIWKKSATSAKTSLPANWAKKFWKSFKKPSKFRLRPMSNPSTKKYCRSAPRPYTNFCACF